MPMVYLKPTTTSVQLQYTGFLERVVFQPFFPDSFKLCKKAPDYCKCTNIIMPLGVTFIYSGSKAGRGVILSKNIKMGSVCILVLT